MRNLLFILFIAGIAVGCQEVFEPEVEEVDPFLVIQGTITTEAGPHSLTIFKSTAYTAHPIYEGQSGASVYLLDQNMERYDYVQTNSGSYQVTFAETDLPRAGDTYTLHIITKEGDEYVSTPQEIRSVPKISELYCKYGLRSVLTEDAYGAPMEIEFSGLDILMETHGAYPVNNCYMYSYEGYEEHHTNIMIGYNPYYLYRHRKLNARYGSKIKTVNADDFGGFFVRNESVVFLSKDDMNTYTPIVPDTIEVTGTKWEGTLFKLNQLSISPDVYNFYSSVEDQLNAEGKMFDPAVPQIKGNIHCVSDTTKTVVGVFAASDITTRYAYFYVDYRGRAFSRQISGYPELWLDTCSWGQPDDWISPPF
ncbi:MAG: DUF4249 family protein [Bacteroidales bacterium]|nr:DUF4249 family protein [Bacteroidales bacterium]